MLFFHPLSWRIPVIITVRPPRLFAPLCPEALLELPYLASEADSSYVNGQIIRVNGGESVNAK